MALSAVMAKQVDSYINDPTKNQWYKDTFAKYEAKGGGIAFAWSWWAFFFGPFYLFYRKAYVYGIFWIVLKLLLLTLLSIGGIVFWVVDAIVLPYFVYRRFKYSIALAKQQAKGTTAQHAFIRCRGGRHTWPLFFVPIYGLFLSFWFYLFGGIFYHAMQMPEASREQYIMQEILKNYGGEEFKSISIEIDEKGDDKKVKIEIEKK